MTRSFAAFARLLPCFSLLCASAEALDVPSCESCEGSGQVVVDCHACDGKGKAQCVGCEPLFSEMKFSEKALFIERKTNPGAEDLEEAERIRKGAEEATEKLHEAFDALGQVAVPGRVACPAFCIKGKSIAGFGRPCRVCDAEGSVKCSVCRGKGEGTCAACGGKRKQQVACRECSGSGSTPSLETCSVESAATCPWCDGRQVRECSAFSEEPVRSRACRSCAGSGSVACGTCKGTKRARCQTCASTGLDTRIDQRVTGRKPEKCDACRGKGFTKCGDCKRDGWPCKPCAGTGAVETKCPDCFGGGVAVCMGCWRGSSLGWYLAGQRLAVAERHEVAVAYLETALRREEAARDAALAVFEGELQERNALKRDYARRVNEIEDLVRDVRRDVEGS